ncbi:ribosomal protein L9, N-terminal domain containing protein [Theileria equi strain WA]|uniref:Ribosomal protein L9, N-terminal domain containing protein n=1 Tax=Theileria equi strain WA TaxID=1537102 RepID=L0AUN1_THEEQ|nr:ribosomal protein L9, N-terminal domain containing protein [Theileria equi strain WA]AFZ79260.1 ribosomal protein L9, N-terminal domain containing protein [Theileria equi strain WA]|eukprot:XP_004828926.1 ribosomal protein L9, N-terminal domain containing protein [Theileria equi strain WA]
MMAHKFRYVKVTLEKDTPDIGKQGEIVAVNRSFAFNYLVPFGFARYTTRAELVGQALEKDYKEALTNVRRSAALQLKNKIGNNCVLNFEVLAKEKGSQALNIPLRPINIIEKLKERRVFTPLDMLREQDVEINTNSGFITKFGTYSASLTLDEEIKASVKIVVSEAPLDCSFIPY